MSADNPSTPSASPGMPRRLTAAELSYVLSCLASHVRCSVPLSELVAYAPSPSAAARVVVVPSDSPLDTEARSEGMPLLFPSAGWREGVPPYEMRGGIAVFAFDILKAAFYLLSGYQEYASPERDAWGRFPYAQSVQARMGFVGQPVVNQYFRLIVQCIVALAHEGGFEASEVNSLGGPSLYLTHDIDLAHYHTWRKTLYRWAQVLGARPCDTSRRRLLGAAWRSLLTMMGVRHDKDTYWSFDILTGNEAHMGYTSTYFFLPDDGGPFPPDYDIAADPDMRSLVKRLAARGDTIGLHAPIRCQTASAYARAAEIVQPTAPVCRQHFLALDQLTSLREMETAGIRLDCTLGFSEHEGFRNSYCHPFHPFDHERQRPLDLLEVPMAVMDVTLLRNRALSIDECFLSIGELLDQVREHGGVFCLLWHNSTFDETYWPGVTRFYEDLMLMLTQYQLRPLSPADLLGSR